MNLELVGISGKWKGRSWRITETPLVLGRGEDAAIQIPHRTVSRAHCRIAQEGKGVTFTDMGSRNPALVNGVPAREAFLTVGDEVAVGPAVFLIANAAYAGPRNAARPPEADTGSWDDNASTPSAGNSLETARPKTVDDLALLFAASREFGRASTTGEVLAALRSQVQTRFAPDAFWFARVQGDGDLSLSDNEPVPVNVLQPLTRHLRGALHEQRGLAFDAPEPGATILAAPVQFAGVDLGVLAVTLPAARGRNEGDLVMLTLLARALAPVLYAVEDLEQLRRDVARLRVRAGESATLVGDSKAMAHVRGLLARAAKTDLPVVITGETGTGKELAARTLLAQSSRRNKPFVVVNCAAIPRDLFEGELFGHEKGAFTGATETSPGLLAHADGGTLFLDEIGDLSLENQARILRVIEYGTFRRIGAARETKVNVRVVAATNKDLMAAIRVGEFREDLYHRLNGFEVHIPPLRERPSDIPVLAAHFFEMAKTLARRPVKNIAPDAMEYLCACPWPGNARQLRSCIQRAVATASNSAIGRADVIMPRQQAVDGESPPLTLRELEQRHLEVVLAQCNGDMQKAARLLDIGRSTLYRKVAEYGIRL